MEPHITTEEEKVISSFQVNKESIKDIGEGKVTFPGGLTITDNSEMWSGMKYDIKTLNLETYKGQITADHRSSIESVIGKVSGLKKIANRRVTIDGIDFAIKQNALALYAYEMLLAGYLTDFSIETIGPWPNEEGLYENAQLVGLSLVVIGNNKKAHVNTAIANKCIKQCEEDGIDTIAIKNMLNYPIDKENGISDNTDNSLMEFTTINNTQTFPVGISYKNVSGKIVNTILQPNESIDVSKDQEEALNKVISEATAPVEKKEEAKVDADLIADAVNKAIAPFTSKIDELKTQIDENAVEPQFTTKSVSIIKNKFGNMDADERATMQINAVLNARTDMSAMNTLNELNKFHLEEYKKTKLVKNSMTIADFGNFIIPTEMLKDIEGIRTDYKALLAAFNFRDTLSMQMAWLNRSGDIAMTDVEFCDDGDDGNLKPISEYTATIQTSNLTEFAAVTPVCNAATRFLAVDMLQDINEGYRLAYDKKLAEMIIGRLQQAVNTSGNIINYNTASASNLNALYSVIDTASEVAENITNGIWVMSTATYYELLKRRMQAGATQDSGFDLFTTGETGQFLGSRYVVVPNSLMPKLGSSQTRTITIDGVAITIDQGLFYVDPSTFAGRTSGGLNYSLSTEASYEDQGVVKSAFQRDELLLRGYAFRGGAVKDVEKVAGTRAVNIS